MSNTLRKSLGLSSETLSNYNTSENKLNTANGFDWSGDNPDYTLYDSTSTTSDSTSDTGTTTAGGGTATMQPGY